MLKPWGKQLIGVSCLLPDPTGHTLGGSTKNIWGVTMQNYLCMGLMAF